MPVVARHSKNPSHCAQATVGLEKTDCDELYFAIASSTFAVTTIDHLRREFCLKINEECEHPLKSKRVRSP